MHLSLLKRVRFQTFSNVCMFAQTRLLRSMKFIVIKYTCIWGIYHHNLHGSIRLVRRAQSIWQYPRDHNHNGNGNLDCDVNSNVNILLYHSQSRVISLFSETKKNFINQSCFISVFNYLRIYMCYNQAHKFYSHVTFH